MPEPIRPASTKTHGKQNWIVVLAIANVLAPTVAEVTAGSALDVTRILFASTGKPSQSTNRVTAERRLGDTKTYEHIGDSAITGGDILYAFADQGAVASDGKKLFEKIPDGTTAFLVNRRGIGRATAVIAGQFVHVYPVEFGPSFPADAGDAEASEAAMTATFAVTGDIGINVAIVA